MQHRWVLDAGNILKENPFAGDQVPVRLTPRRYKRKYAVTFVYRYRQPEGYRLIYTLARRENVFIVVLVDMLTHKEYERVFNY